MSDHAQAPAGPAPRPWSRRASVGALVLVTFAFLATPLLGLGSLLPADILEIASPWAADREVGSSPDNITLSDTLDLHAHFASLAHDIRSGDVSWWDRALSGGIPVLKAGYSPVLWIYLAVPAWFAPAAAAAIRTLVAAGLTYGFVRSLGAERAPAVVAGVAYGLSGFMVGWAGWPQANVAAFAPGLLWSAELLVRSPTRRRAAPVALCVAAMLVSNFPLVTAYATLAAVVYGIWRVLASEQASSVRAGARALVRPALWGGVGVVLGFLIAAVHVVAFSEFHDWGDTGARSQGSGDSSIGGPFLLTVLVPRAWGSSHTGHAFWGVGTNWVEAQAYAGVAVLVLAFVALAARGRRHGASAEVTARASAARALWAIAIGGAWIAYLGGPVSDLAQSAPLLGDQAVGRARVVMSIAFAALAGLGLQAWIDSRRGAPGVDLRRAIRIGVASAAVLAVVTAPWALDWAEGAHDRALVTETVEAALVPLAAGAAMVALLLAASRSRQVAGWVPALAVVIVAVELLVFARPVATVVDRDDADPTEPAHAFLASALAPGERIAGEGRTFFPNTAQLTGIDDARGHLITSKGWREMLTALDPGAFGPPGTVTNPSLRADVDLSSPILDRMAVRYWAAEPSSAIRGTLVEPEPPEGFVALTTEPLTTELTVPAGGLRGVVVAIGESTVGPGRLRVDVAHGTDVVSGWRRLDEIGPDSVVTVPLAGEELGAGEVVTVALATTPEAGVVRLGAIEGRPVLGTVAPDDDGLRLVYADGVALYERSLAPVARLAHAAIGTGDDEVAVRLAQLPIADSVALVEPGPAIDLPAAPPEGAEGTVDVTRVDGGAVDLAVVTTAPALVVVSQVRYPGWTATVDGDDVPILTADGAFPAVLVEAGTHEVRLRYRPRSLWVAGAVSAGGIAIAVALWMLGSRNPRRAPEPIRRASAAAR